mgnify:CR=1 FL=1
MISWRRACLVAVLLVVLLAPVAPASTQGSIVPPPLGPVAPSGPDAAVSGAIRLPAGYLTPPLELPEAGEFVSQAAALRAVAIVGDVGDGTATYRNDMEGAAAALESHGVAVARFYYGVTSFTWGDIVAAAQGANFLLYMGHGVYWGDCAHPDGVGGFYLGGGQFVSPDALRTDLAGRLAADAVVIFSHACFTAGSTACDPAGTPGVAEAQRRVALYAAPFVDLGMQAYFANNYFNAARDIVNRLLADPAVRNNAGDVFRATFPNNPATHYDLSYPTAGYDLWLNGTDGAWNNAFVGQPGYVFAGDVLADELGGLPSAVGFLYSTVDAAVTPITATLVPANVGTGDPLTWTVVKSGSWFSVSPASGTTPTAIVVTPGSLDGLSPGTYTGAITVTVTSPPGVLETPQRIGLTLKVTANTLHHVHLPLVAH